MFRSTRLCRVLAVALAVATIGWAALAPSAVAAPPAAKAAPAKPQPKKTHGPPKHRSGVAAVEAALAKPIRAEFVETPLADVVDYFKEVLQITIHLDQKAFKDASVETTAPVTFRGIDLRFKTILNAMLGQLGLTWTIDDGLLVITTPEGAARRPTIQVYDVADLVVCLDGKNQLWDDYETLIDVIAQTIEPQDWDRNGGPGTIAGASLGTAKVLVVAQSYQNHERLAKLLEDVRAIAAKKSRDAEPPRRDRPVAGKQETTTPMCGFPAPKTDAAKK